MSVRTFSSIPRRASLAPLVTGQFGLPSHDHPPLLRTLAPFARPRSDQFPLELCKPAQDGQHKAPVGGGRVCPRVP